jgi:hypothetical protein
MGYIGITVPFSLKAPGAFSSSTGATEITWSDLIVRQPVPVHI